MLGVIAAHRCLPALTGQLIPGILVIGLMGSTQDPQST